MGYVEMTRSGETVVLKGFDSARRFLMEEAGWQAVEEYALPGDEPAEEFEPDIEIVYEEADEE